MDSGWSWNVSRRYTIGAGDAGTSCCDGVVGNFVFMTSSANCAMVISRDRFGHTNSSPLKLHVV